VVQVQAFFTIGLAAYLTGERVQPFQVAALLLAVAGIGVILVHTDAATTPLGLGLVITAALCWAGGNIVVRSTPNVNMLAYVVWASLFSAPPLFALSFVFEGWPAIRDGLGNSDLTTWLVVLYQGVANTLFGYAVWGWLLSRYPAVTIAPMALLVPVFGMGASALWLDEPLQDWKLIAAALVMTGLCLNVLWPRFAAIRGARTPPAA
jgi:O-acetylserine/cysteine efflux transporter